jgi:hypothetical protein
MASLGEWWKKTKLIIFQQTELPTITMLAMSSNWLLGRAPLLLNNSAGVSETSETEPRSESNGR